MQDENRSGGEDPVEKVPSASPVPAAGPHARKDLTNPDATPGSGSLPDPDEDEIGGGVS